MKKILSLFVAAAALSLAACSSEPSDWRPDKKVSVDVIPPGTRPTDNFTHEAQAVEQHEGSSTGPTRGDAVSPSDVMTSDTQKGTAESPEQIDDEAQAKGTIASPATDTARGQQNAPK